MTSIALWLGAVCLTGAGLAHAQGSSGVCRVMTTGASANDGSSWAQAMDLPSALGNAACNEIWVAEGAYKPTTGADRAATFAIGSGVAVYGGFDGTESARDERDPAAHRSVLSGDIDGNDTVDADGATVSAADIQGNNSIHVVSMDGSAATNTVLDGFIISGGLANDTSSLEVGGGGGLICNGNGAGQDCSPTLRQLVFRGNAAITGGGMLCVGQNQGTCGAMLESITFAGNTGESAGAMAIASTDGSSASPVLHNVTFSGNSAVDYGGAIANIGASGGSSSPVLRNLTFSGNSAGIGGAIANVTFGGIAAPLVVNAIAWGNGPAAVASNDPALTLRHSIVEGGCPANSVCSDLLDSDPQLTLLQDVGGATPAMLPGTGSAALDAGTCIDAPLIDQRGLARPQGAGCDIGAVEVRQARLEVDVIGAGKVGAVIVPPPLGAAIADCRQDAGICSAWYGVEPDAPAVILMLQPDAGYVLESASGCGGSLAGNNFTTSVLAGDCTVAVVFAPAAYSIAGTVTGLAGSGLVLALNGGETLPVGADGAFAFAALLPNGSAYAVTVDTQPSQPTQSCAVTNGSGTVGTSDIANVVVNCGAAATYTVGGTLSGLAPGASVALSINGGSDLVLAANGVYVFAPRFAPGDGYLASVTAQPAGQHCTLSHAEGAVGSANVTDVDVDCAAGGAQLQLSVTDGGDYARYGQVRDYFVTLSNTGNGPAANVAVSADLDPAFDAANVQWACVGGAPGTACTAEGAGGFADSATLPPGTSLVWIVSVPIHGDSNAADATFLARASGAPDASDTDTLVIFRDGVDVPYADGAGVVDPALRAAALEGGDGVAIETELPAG